MSHGWDHGTKCHLSLWVLCYHMGGQGVEAEVGAHVRRVMVQEHVAGTCEEVYANSTKPMFEEFIAAGRSADICIRRSAIDGS